MHREAALSGTTLPCQVPGLQGSFEDRHHVATNLQEGPVKGLQASLKALENSRDNQNLESVRELPLSRAGQVPFPLIPPSSFLPISLPEPSDLQLPSLSS